MSAANKATSFADPKVARRTMVMLAIGVFLFAKPILEATELGNQTNKAAGLRSFDFLLKVRDWLTRTELPIVGSYPRKAPSKVVVVGVDNGSLDRHGQWPWPRRKVGALVSELRRQGARVIALDAIFGEPEASPVDRLEEALGHPDTRERYGELLSALEEAKARARTDLQAPPELLARGGDQTLIDAIAAGEDVVAGIALEWEGSATAQISWKDPGPEIPIPAQALRALELHRGKPLENADEVWRKGLLMTMLISAKGLFEVVGDLDQVGQSGAHMRSVHVGGDRRVQGLYLPYGDMLLAATGTGFLNDLTTIDRVVRALPLAQTFEGRTLPSVSLSALARYFRGQAMLRSEVVGGRKVPVAIQVRNPEGTDGLEIPIEEDATAWVNHYPPPGERVVDLEVPADLTAPVLVQVAAGDVLDSAEGKLSPAKTAELHRRLDGRIAFVGVTALGLSDVRETPLGVLRPGVEMHTTVAASLMEGEVLTQGLNATIFTWVVQLSLLLIMAISLPLVSPTNSLLVLVGVIGAGFGLCLVGLLRGLVLFPWIVIFPQMVLFALGMAYLNRHHNKDKAWIEGMFKRYVAPEYVEQLKRNKGKLDLGGQETPITAFFTDLASFSTLSEQFEANRLFAFLGEYLGEMTDILDRYGGTLDKYSGDAVIAFFGAPIPQEDHARRACMAALDMRVRLQQLNAIWQNNGRYPELNKISEQYGRWWAVRARIGLNTGTCATGHLGTAERGNYTMMGDHVNLAARLEGICKYYRIEICVSQATKDAAGDALVTREVDTIRVKGKTVPTCIYEVVGRPDELSKARLAFVKSWEVAMQLVRERRYDKAKAAFERTLAMIERDRLAELWIERCERFIAEPPAEDWDGVITMNEK